MEPNERAVLSQEHDGQRSLAALLPSFLVQSLCRASVAPNPPSNIEFVDPKTLHLTGEFTEANLGTRVETDGRITTRFVATQFAFVPHCVVVPANKLVTLRLASPDVIHGILISGDQCEHHGGARL